jgi:predicted lipoprotein with Yx(FWY)xxD motif
VNAQRIVYSALAAAGLVVVLAIALTGHSSARGMSARATVQTADSSFGRILVDRKGRTLYLFEKDKGGRSACAGQCATFWPPLIAAGKATAAPGLKKVLLGTTKRRNGARQVTYAGHPLYRFSLDKGAGQATGQGMEAFGGGWYVVSPAGRKVEDEAAEQPTRGGY